ncbi:MAG: pro-sigmaK processing inhibitor BofA [Ruminococcaceae bacterium]|nr:pro-sigmaK processing inhibitor BofA [Oscillospiraceae bacterium]
MAENFVGLIGFLLGVLIVGVSLRILFVPLKYVIKVLLNSVVGAVLLVIINLFSDKTGIFIGVNPLNSLIIGLLGVPGLIGLIILKLVL